MTLAEWFRNSKARFRSQPPRDAFIDSLHELYIGGLRRLATLQSTSYTAHWEYDWEVLVILDACRVDMFKEATREREWLPPANRIETFPSLGSTSSEWMGEMFSDKYQEELQRTAYVTGNMFYQHIDLSEMPVVSAVPPEYIPEYDITTVPPRHLTDRVIDGWRRRKEFDFERLIVHYMQPHTPFRTRPDWFDSETKIRNAWGQSFAELRDGEISRQTFVDAYRDNLDWVLDEVAVLKDNVDASIGVSADHGNGLGEWGVYGHPGWINTPAVRHVPYASIEGVDRNSYHPSDRLTADESEISDEEIGAHLEALGYR